MNRKIKALGLALFAVFALSAVSASAASAVVQHHITSDTATETTSLTAKSIGKQVFKATPGNDRVECEEVNVHGEFIGSEATEITVEPTFTKCKAFQNGEELTASVESTGCHFTFTGETTEDSTEEQTAVVHLPPCETQEGGGAGFMINVTFLELECIDVVPEQTLHGIKFTDDEANPNALIIDAKVHGIHSKTTGACVVEGEETHTEGTFEGSSTVTGYETTEHTKENEVNLNLLTT